ncbi:hypothetical protein HAX54_011066 [Datura stramonium]|uniref:Uncharacterized protein n=1 Tax=Datura stramonium TaxID=4076 RepID=A0ABS8TH98_DATST|nr:hypothetical protein [Datura stramonium]
MMNELDLPGKFIGWAIDVTPSTKWPSPLFPYWADPVRGFTEFNGLSPADLAQLTSITETGGGSGWVIVTIRLVIVTSDSGRGNSEYGRWLSAVVDCCAGGWL